MFILTLCIFATFFSAIFSTFAIVLSTAIITGFTAGGSIKHLVFFIIGLISSFAILHGFPFFKAQSTDTLLPVCCLFAILKWIFFSKTGHFGHPFVAQAIFFICFATALWNTRATMLRVIHSYAKFAVLIDATTRIISKAITFSSRSFLIIRTALSFSA